MENKPSFFTSTFSLMSLIVIIGFTGLCIWMKDLNTLKEIAMILLGAYGVRKGVELAKNTKPNNNAPQNP